MKLGDAFRMGVPPKFTVPHLFFVISDPTQHGGAFVAVNITKDYIRAGRECVLQIGDHPWITAESFVTFRDALEITPAKAVGLHRLIGTEVFIENPLDPAVLRRIIVAAKASKSLRPVCKKYI
ncbi:MAG: hypothetical protein P4L26_08005 [Terracidiphilus sp.]|nr:hypothetical protein [Terracidiphilus sp.]